MCNKIYEFYYLNGKILWGCHKCFLFVGYLAFFMYICCRLLSCLLFQSPSSFITTDKFDKLQFTSALMLCCLSQLFSFLVDCEDFMHLLLVPNSFSDVHVNHWYNGIRFETLKRMFCGVRYCKHDIGIWCLSAIYTFCFGKGMLCPVSKISLLFFFK